MRFKTLNWNLTLRSYAQSFAEAREQRQYIINVQVIMVKLAQNQFLQFLLKDFQSMMPNIEKEY